MSIGGERTWAKTDEKYTGKMADLHDVSDVHDSIIEMGTHSLVLWR